MNFLCAALGIEKPVIQGPMAWISTAPLVSAVSEAGGLGILGTGVGLPEFIMEQVKLVKQKTNKKFAINLGFHPRFFRDENFPAILDILKTENVPIIHLDALCDCVHRLEKNFAIPRIKAFKDLDMKVIVKTFTVEDALVAQEAGADVIVAKGWEGGGHITFQSTFVCVPHIAEAVSLPVVASGGIANGMEMAAAMLLGASGVEMGTAFLLAEETEINQKSKQAIMNARDFCTVEAGFSTGEPCRQLHNALADKIIKIESAFSIQDAKAKVLELVANSSRRGMVEGDVENGAIMIGQCASQLNSIRPAAEIIDSLLKECSKTLKEAQNIQLAWNNASSQVI